MAKYDALRAYLEGLPGGQKRVTLGFGRIEHLLGEPLPPSAFKYEAWWLGSRTWRDQVQVQAWESAGWTVDELDLHLHTVTFRRR
ncbi:MAG: hypothetical protein HY690_12620 [Chloroflexi bacterium]|nr:hypothetical protein [Chloroflexota bacterium]